MLKRSDAQVEDLLNAAESLQGRYEYSQAESVLREALAVARSSAKPEVVCRILEELAELVWSLGRPEEALARLSLARDIYEMSGDIVAAKHSEHLAGDILMWMELPLVALEKYLTAGQGGKAGKALIALGRFDEGLETLLRAREGYMANGKELLAASVDLETGELLSESGRFDQAVDWLTRAVQLYEKHGSSYWAGQAHDSLVEALARSRNASSAKVAEPTEAPTQHPATQPPRDR